ncbi:hypothetical protein NP233_g2416 [Leucocoprinus birnbaumii]|uniref:NACHT domain-containing protein n=1 Tax=Leucocoprinus birnbaumii TaxID=56174 RepID=A0AAD5W4K6_9AGAR|nr:hypothetical protein NP233_g2416 [Leucocoprinus birnbaumii]
MIGNINQSNEAFLMDTLGKHTLQGAEFNSSERYPPPTCHPGTRVDLSDRIWRWVNNTTREKRILWLHGPAGVGKSATMQTVAEEDSDSQSPVLGATLFFSRPSKRDDPQRVFVTIAYQLAVKYPEYRQHVLGMLTVDPKLPTKSMKEQFKRLIAQPFGHMELLKSHYDTVVIVIDGLDECKGEQAQRDLMLLIAKFNLDFPSSPLIWIIASRPESHLQVLFSSEPLQSTHLDVDIPIDSDEACRDVELFLRDRFTEIRQKFPSSFLLTQEWPRESQFTKLSMSSSGLFVFASTAIRFIEDEGYNNPVMQLEKVLAVIDSTTPVELSVHPLASLDGLYASILSAIPADVYESTNEILLQFVGESGILKGWDFSEACNFLGFSQPRIFSSISKLHSVLKVPRPDNALLRELMVYHASFTDYLNSPRSGSFFLDPSQIRLHALSLSVRVMREAHCEAESNVRASRILISWPSRGQDPQDLQRRMAAEAIQLFNNLYEAHGYEGSPVDLKLISAFFRDLEFPTAFLETCGRSFYVLILNSFLKTVRSSPLRGIVLVTY